MSMAMNARKQLLLLIQFSSNWSLWLVGMSERSAEGKRMGRQQYSPLRKPEDTTLLVEGSREHRISLSSLLSMINQDSCGWPLSNI